MCHARYLEDSLAANYFAKRDTSNSRQILIRSREADPVITTAKLYS